MPNNQKKPKVRKISCNVACIEPCAQRAVKCTLDNNVKIDSVTLSIMKELAGQCQYNCSTHRRDLVRAMDDCRLYRDPITQMIWDIKEDSGYQADHVRGVYSLYFDAIPCGKTLMQWNAGHQAIRKLSDISGTDAHYVWQPYTKRWGCFVLPYSLPLGTRVPSDADMMGIVNGQMVDKTTGHRLRFANSKIVFNRLQLSFRLVSTRKICFGEELVTTYQSSMVNRIKSVLRVSTLEHSSASIRRRKMLSINNHRRVSLFKVNRESIDKENQIRDLIAELEQQIELTRDQQIGLACAKRMRTIKINALNQSLKEANERLNALVGDSV